MTDQQHQNLDLASQPKGTLFLVPAPLDFGCTEQIALDHVLPAQTIAVASSITHWVAENAKTTRAYLKRINEYQPLQRPIQEQDIQELPREAHKKGDHHGSGKPFDARHLLQPALDGHNIGLISEAGMPGIADPGSSVVRAAHLMKLTVRPLTGPISLLLALAASGLNGQLFAFTGYLPQDTIARATEIRKLEKLAQQSGQSQIIIETPYRNIALWQALVATLKPETWLSVHSGLTLPDAISISMPIKDWRKLPSPAISSKTPAVFCLGL